MSDRFTGRHVVSPDVVCNFKRTDIPTQVASIPVTISLENNACLSSLPKKRMKCLCLFFKNEAYGQSSDQSMSLGGDVTGSLLSNVGAKLSYLKGMFCDWC